MAVRVVSGELRAYIERLQRLAEERDGIAALERKVMVEAKGQGYDTKVIRRVLAELKLDADARVERRAMLDLYLGALGELADTPLGWAAVEAGEKLGRMAAVNGALARLEDVAAVHEACGAAAGARA